jgi:hypothetical protein
MSREEVVRVLEHLAGTYLTIAMILYGAGLRLSECLRLRIKDLDFDQRQILVRRSKGKKGRVTPMPEQLVEPLRRLVERRRQLHEQDLSDGTASVWLPFALSRKYPNAYREFCWQYLFASARLSRDPRTGRMHRHHLHKDTFPKHLAEAVKRAGIDKQITSHTFRHSFATHLLMDGVDIRTVQELLGHADIKTTMIYLHVLNRHDVTVTSPLDRLLAPRGRAEPEREDATTMATPVEPLQPVVKARRCGTLRSGLVKSEGLMTSDPPSLVIDTPRVCVAAVPPRELEPDPPTAGRQRRRRATSLVHWRSGLFQVVVALWPWWPQLHRGSEHAGANQGSSKSRPARTPSCWIAPGVVDEPVGTEADGTRRAPATLRELWGYGRCAVKLFREFLGTITRSGTARSPSVPLTEPECDHSGPL